MTRSYCSACGGFHEDVTGGCFLETMTRSGEWEKARLPAVCPLCLGSGIREKIGKENAPLPIGTTTYTNCNGCAGKGWVW